MTRLSIGFSEEGVTVRVARLDRVTLVEAIS